MKFVLGLVCGLVLAALGTLGYVRSGRFDVSATKKAGKMEREMAEMGLDAWVERNAPKGANPIAASPEAPKRGLDHYRENCLVCHGVPGAERSEIARGMNPPPPDLAHRGTQKMTDGQLFFITSHGIRMTGMPAFSPTHKDDEIWALVSFVRHLPQLTADEKAALEKGAEPREHHHEGAGEAREAAESPAPHQHG